jgi:ABC-2 type transport system permease protein
MKSRGIVKWLFATPVKKRDLIFGLLISRALVMLAQVVILTLAGLLFFHVAVPSNPIIVAGFVLLGGFVFLLFGLLIASFADSYEVAAPFTSAIGLPFSFFGNVFFPADRLPEVLQVISRVLPITHLSDGLRAIYLGQTDPQKLFIDLAWLAAWFVVLLFVVIRRFRFEQ